ncbi:MAG: hypothetical protein V1729_02580 [Candidatus Woesearchaeota archaeon]
MNKRKDISIAMIAVLAFIVLLLSGCGFSKGNAQQIESYKFRQGSDGISMKFAEGMPPDQLYIGTEFSTGLKLKNLGAYDADSRATLKVTMPDMTAFQFNDGNEQQVSLRGKSLYVKEGEENIFIFPMKALCFPGYNGPKDFILKNYSRKMKATLCYYYETTADSDICIDTLKFRRQANEKIECAMKDEVLSGGQGGPVGVTRISPQIIPQSEGEVLVQLSISFNKLKGADHTIFSPSRTCGDLEGQNDVDIEVQMGGQALTCEPSTIKLKDRDSVGTVCKRRIEANMGAFTSPVSVNLRYHVQQSLLKQLTVEPPPGGTDCTSLS